MMNTPRGLARSLWFALGLVLVQAGLSGAEEFRAERWVGRDAVIYVEMPRPSVLVERVADEKLRSLLGVIPGLQNRLAKAYEGDDAKNALNLVKALEEKLGMSWSEIVTGLTGLGIVAAVEIPGKGGPPALFVIVSPKDPALPKRISEALIAIVRKAAESNGMPDPVKSADYRGVTGYGIGPNAAIAIVQDRVVFADRAETIKRVIDRALDGLPEKESIASGKVFRGRKAEVNPETLTWAIADVDRLRKLDPSRFKLFEKTDIGQMLLLGGWVDVVKRASWVAAALTWTDRKLAAELTVAAPAEGRIKAYQGYIPPKGSGAAKLASVPGAMLSVSLWRDLAALWEARADLLSPEEVQQLAGLDTLAGQFFGGREFGTGVLGALSPEVRVVVASQDYAAMKPSPDVKYPAFALILDLKPDDHDFAQRMKVAFQSFIGVVNIDGGKSKAPPLELGSETVDGLTIATSHFVTPKEEPGAKEPVHLRHNFSPSAVQVGDHFVISSSVGLARDLAKALQTPSGKPEEATIVAEADGSVLAALLDMNRSRMVMQNMLDKGNDKAQAEGEVGLLSALLRYLGHAKASVQDGPEATRVRLEFQLGNVSK